MLAAKDEKNAVAATLFFNIAHYALRPWPWILIALASLIVFPSLESIQSAFPNIESSIINDDLAYPAMLTFLPAGLLGLVIASLIAAFMSTISTHLNWGSSYIVNDFYKRFIKTSASEKELVWIGRISTVLLMVVAAIVALFLENAKKAFDIIVLMGAGTGLIFILRWFWWRIKAFSEISALLISFIVAIYFKFIQPGIVAPHYELLIGVGITTFGWLAVTYLTRPTDNATLMNFYQLIKPHSYGWKPIIQKAIDKKKITDTEITIVKLPAELLAMFGGIFLVYGALFATGYFLYGQGMKAFICTLLTVAGGIVIWRTWGRNQNS